MLGLNDKVPVLQEGDQLTKTEPCFSVLIYAEVEGNMMRACTCEYPQVLAINLEFDLNMHARDMGHWPNVECG